MANEHDPHRSRFGDDDFGRAARYDSELQPDPELAEGPASTGRIALFAIAIALVLGAVFYGLNNTSVKEAGTAPPAQTAQTQQTNPAAPPAMRDVTPRSNTEQGMTTGSSTTRPSEPQSAPKGTETDRSANPPNNNK
jgi:hypothetical protein